MSDNTTANEPPPIHQLSAPELKALIERGTPFELVDVRTNEERALARIEGSRLLDQAYHDALLRLEWMSSPRPACELRKRLRYVAKRLPTTKAAHTAAAEQDRRPNVNGSSFVQDDLFRSRFRSVARRLRRTFQA